MMEESKESAAADQEIGWNPISLRQAVRLMQDLGIPWWVGGGWAIDLFAGCKSRPHEDFDIVILRRDQLKVQEHMSGWDLRACDPPGELREWKTGEFLEPGTNDIWCRQWRDGGWQVQLMLLDTQGDSWVYRRDMRITAPLDQLTCYSKEGTPFVSPEVQLLFKSHSLRTKDQQDFDLVLPHLPRTEKAWLRSALETIYPEKDHPWIESLQI